jgi:hypothetical protein
VPLMVSFPFHFVHPALPCGTTKHSEIQEEARRVSGEKLYKSDCITVSRDHIV